MWHKASCFLIPVHTARGHITPDFMWRQRNVTTYHYRFNIDYKIFGPGNSRPKERKHCQCADYITMWSLVFLSKTHKPVLNIAILKNSKEGNHKGSYLHVYVPGNKQAWILTTSNEHNWLAQHNNSSQHSLSNSICTMFVIYNYFNS